MKVKRKFIPGDEWIYFKIYTGVKTADTILFELNAIIEEKLDTKKINKWFFIRFYDPDFHLRLRFNVSENQYVWEILSVLNTVLTGMINNKLIWKVQLDTYNRELERYGYHLIEESETIFYYNSLHIISALRMANQMNDENLRWRLGLFIVDRYLSFGNYSIEEKLKLFEVLKNNFGKEMNSNKSVKKIISKMFNENKYEIENLLNLKTNSPKISHFINTLNQSFGSKLSVLLNSIRNQTDVVYYHEIIASHIHMIFNRLFIMRNRQAEYVCYEIFYLFYKSQIARNKFKNSKLENY